MKSPHRIDKERERSKKKSRDLHKQAIAALGGKCVCCGETDTVFLAGDHILGGGSKHRKEVSKRKIWRQIATDPEVRKLFQCLCHNCNFAKHVIGYCPHELKRLHVVEAA